MQDSAPELRPCLLDSSFLSHIVEWFLPREIILVKNGRKWGQNRIFEFEMLMWSKVLQIEKINYTKFKMMQPRKNHILTMNLIFLDLFNSNLIVI